MAFNIVHDIQKSYRKTIQAFSCPGKIVDLSSEVKQIEMPINCLKITKALISMLLDTDTNFYAYSNLEGISEKISQLTYSQETTVENASYVIVTKDSNSHLNEVIEKANVGTLTDPHLAALIICECNDIQKNAKYLLQGPGIKDKDVVDVDVNCEWLEARNKKNHEFPLGVDLVFVDKKNRLVAFPRTTKIERM